MELRGALKETCADRRCAQRRIAFFLALVLFAIVLLRHAWLCDDAFITLRTVRNLLEGFGPVWQPGERVQAYTHPLWMLLLAGGARLLTDLYLTAVVVSLILSVAAFAVFLFGLRHDTAAALLGAALLVSCKSFMDYSTSGLENPLTHFLYVVFVVIFLRQAQDAPSLARVSSRRLFVLTLLATLLVCTRHDLVIVVGPPLGYEIWRARRGWIAVLLGGLPFVAWEIVSLVYYGFPFPNSAYAKLGAGIPLRESLLHGLSYFVSQAKIDPLTLAVLAAALTAVALVRTPALVALAVGLGAYLLYFMRVGGDFMVGRFFSVMVLGSAAILTTALDCMRGRRWLWCGFPALLILGVLVTPHPTLTSDEDYRLQGPPIDPRGVADERAVHYDATGFLRSPEQRRLGFLPFVLLGQHLAAGRATVTSTVGRIGFFARPDAIIIDELGLTDPLIARLPKKPGPWRVGHLFRRIPDGYQATREQGRNLISDPEIAELYRHLDPIVHGPIWTWTRFVEIWRMNTGAWSPSLDASPGSVR